MKGEARVMQRAVRERAARALADLGGHEERQAHVRQLMERHGAELEKAVRGGYDWRLRLLGRTATSTNSPESAIGNWIAATLKEFGH